MKFDDAIAIVHADRISRGLAVRVTGIKDYPGAYTRFFNNIADRDAYMERCAGRCETAVIWNGD